jgi:hypothetical protein
MSELLIFANNTINVPPMVMALVCIGSLIFLHGINQLNSTAFHSSQQSGLRRLSLPRQQ